MLNNDEIGPTTAEAPLLELFIIIFASVVWRIAIPSQGFAKQVMTGPRLIARYTLSGRVMNDLQGPAVLRTTWPLVRVVMYGRVRRSHALRMRLRVSRGLAPIMDWVSV